MHDDDNYINYAYVLYYPQVNFGGINMIVFEEGKEHSFINGL